MSSMTISEQDQGSELRVHVGDELTLSLSTIPGTGYSWNVSSEDREILAEISQPTFEKTTDVHKLGAPEQQIFHFRVGSAGTRQLQLEYRRPWDKLEMAAKTFSITIVAQE